MRARYHAFLGPGGVSIRNLRELYDAAVCERCLIPRGRRTDAPMGVFFDDGQSRRYGGLLAQLHERPLGPSYCLYTDRFLEWLLPGEREALSWRPVKVLNPTKITRPVFESLPARVHVPVAMLRGGDPEMTTCEACGRASDPEYPLDNSLPDWVTKERLTPHEPQPYQFVAKESLPDPVPAAFTIGTPQFGIRIVLTAPITPQRRKKRQAAIGSKPVGVVPGRLTVR